MASEKEIHGNVITSSNQLAAILLVSAAFISAGVVASSQIKGCNQARAAVLHRDFGNRTNMDSEMQRKYQAMVSQRTKIGNISKGRIPLPTMAPVLVTRR